MKRIIVLTIIYFVQWISWHWFSWHIYTVLTYILQQSLCYLTYLASVAHCWLKLQDTTASPQCDMQNFSCNCDFFPYTKIAWKGDILNTAFHMIVARKRYTLHTSLGSCLGFSDNRLDCVITDWFSLCFFVVLYFFPTLSNEERHASCNMIN